MAIPEACGLWIEQRVQEELERKGDTGASLREIGRAVAAEVEKYFETKVNPEAIRKKAERMAGTNVPPEQPAETTTETPQFEKLEKPQHGGARPGAGRKAKRALPSEMDLSRVNGALSFATIAITVLESIPQDDPYRNDALSEVEAWIAKERGAR